MPGRAVPESVGDDLAVDLEGRDIARPANGQDPSHRIRVSHLARLVGVSTSHLGALVRDATGGGVLAYHTGLKMARSRRLLDTTDLHVAEVGREVGYADPFYSSRQFSRVHGMSPSDSRVQRTG